MEKERENAVDFPLITSPKSSKESVEEKSSQKQKKSSNWRILIIIASVSKTLKMTTFLFTGKSAEISHFLNSQIKESLGGFYGP